MINNLQKKDAKMMECDYCQTKRCIKCLNITDTAYKQLGGREDFPWFCQTCVVKAMRAIKEERDIETRCKNFLTNFEENTNKSLASMQKQIDDIRGLVTNNATPVPTTNINRHTPHSVPHIVDKVCDSIKDREQRVKNIIIFKVTESEETSDSDIVDHISAHTTGRINIPCTTKRLGRIVENQDDTDTQRSRPLLVSFENEQDKIDVIRNAYKMRDAEEPYNNMSIAQDMSPEERKQNRELKETAKARNQANQNTNDLYVVRGLPWDRKVVKVKKRVPFPT